MLRRSKIVFLVALFTALGNRLVVCRDAGSTFRAGPIVIEAYAQMHLNFEPNRGQASPEVKFLARGTGYNLLLTQREAIIRFNHVNQSREPDSRGSQTTAAVRLAFTNANPTAHIEAQRPLSGTVNYLGGNDSSKWRAGVPIYGGVRYKEAWRGVDVVFYGNQGHLEYDCIVAPGGDPNSIGFTIEGAHKIEIDMDGNLIIHLKDGSLVQRRPVIYQMKEGRKQEIAGRYVLTNKNRIGFKTSAYDTGSALVIDPVLDYSTYLGGSAGEFPLGIAVDGAGNTYLTGQTQSVDFPTANPIQLAFGAPGDAFVAKLNPTGSGLVYATYIGGSGLDRPRKIVVDAAGNAYVVGHTASLDFPTTAGTYQSSSQGGQEGFILKLNASGSAFVYSTYLGGTGLDQCLDLAVDSQGSAYVTGQTFSADFPTVGAMQASRLGILDSFVTKFNSTGSGLIYSTYLGGSSGELGEGIAVDNLGNAYITGRTGSADFPTVNALQATFGGGIGSQLGFGSAVDAFVAKVNASGSALVYSTFLGGNGDDSGWQIVADSSGNAYVTGATSSPNFPTQNALQPGFGGGTGEFGFGPLDAFLAKISSSGSLISSTYLGGSGDENPTEAGLAVDAAGSVTIVGTTTSANFPKVNLWQSARAGFSDGFVSKLGSNGSTLIYSSLLGGSLGDGVARVAVAANGKTFVAGQTSSPDFPTANPLQSFRGASDWFVTRISAENSPAGSNISIVPIDASTQSTPATLTFSSIQTPGNTTLTVSNSGPVPPAGFLIGTPPTYYNVSTTAAFSGAVTICVHYTGASFTNESDLKLYHLEGGLWIDATTSLDTAADLICGQVTSLSPFVVAEDGFEALLTQVDRLPLSDSQKNSLVVKILDSQQFARQGRYAGTIDELKSFVNKLQALTKTARLDSATSDSLIRPAQALAQTFQR